MEVSSKVWVVTGAGSGMGRELVLALLGRGARVAAVDRNPDGLVEVAGVAAAGERLSIPASPRTRAWVVPTRPTSTAPRG